MKITENYWYKRFPQGSLGGEVFFDEPMARHTTLGVGGLAEVLAVPAEIISVQGILIASTDDDLPLTVLGGGSNVVIRDDGISGITVSLMKLTRLEAISGGSDSEPAKLFVEAGVSLARLLRFCAEKGFSGLEELSGIPGSVGGAIRMNAGSFETEIKDAVESVVVMNRKGRISRISRNEIPFRYRGWGLDDELLILGANVSLEKSEPVKVLNRMTECQHEKQQRQPLSDRSAGCVFKNPEGDISAWKLIDAAGLRGASEGGISVSTLHANFFINDGSGTATQFISLMERVREEIKNKSGVDLESEVRIIG